MSDSDLELRIEGPDAERLADELAELLEAELDTRPRRRKETPAQSSAGPVMRGDPLTVVAVVLAIPGAVLAAQDLARRLEVKKKADRLLAWVRGKAGEGAKNRIELVDSRKRTLRLDRADGSEVIEIATEVTVRVTRTR